MLDDLLGWLLTGMRPVWAGLFFAIAALLWFIALDGFTWIGLGFAALLGAILGVLLLVAEFSINMLKHVRKGR
jgi:hypothetical protein